MSEHKKLPARGGNLAVVNSAQDLGMDENLPAQWRGGKSSKSKITDDAMQAANDIKADLLQRLVIDETDPFFLASIEGYILHANDPYRMMALKSGGALANPPEVGGNGDLTMSVRAVLDEVSILRKSVRYTERLIIDGEERIFSTRYLPVDNADKQVVAVVGTYRDITAETKHAESVTEAQIRFKDFARATSDWFWEVDKNLRFRMLSDRFTAITGTPAAIVVGQRLDEFGSLEDNMFGDSTIDSAVHRRTAFRDQLLEYKSTDGKELKFHISGVPVFERESGEFKGYRGAGMDMTEQYVKAEEDQQMRDTLEMALKELTVKNKELDEANTKSEKSLHAKNEFLASMSHELKTPLNAIIGFAEMMKMEVFGSLDDHYKSYAGDILNSGRHLLTLIEDILDMGVIDNGNMKVKPEVLSLKALFDNANKMCSFKGNAQALDLTHLTVEKDFDVFVDERRMTQIIVNLLSNAFKFTHQDGKVGIDVRRSGTAQLAFTVWDSGIGISKEDVARIFDKFQQATDDVYSHNVEGTGLGLHISRELARLMGGDIKVASKLGEGSAFTVTIPLARIE
jgi:PAS domain S-box-containing protein